MDYETCSRAMEAPVAEHIDNCWGKEHDDYEGGYYVVDGIGAFGREVYAG